ncbi:MBL fold metallo-hydrolase [Halobium palmae]|uniref:MBL fold metallo-hydrolase n=1 Tax=Halobium palmae TaxID=1776492 RepID=A0ABD5RXG7_9EURY
MELVDGVYGLRIGATLGGNRTTISPVAVETSRGLLLVDVGLPGGVDELEAALDAEGLDLGDAWAVLVTHQDLDHAGCLATVVERTDAAVFTHEVAAAYVEGRTELVKSTEERPMEPKPTPVDVRLVGGESFATRAGPMNVVATPGHAPGHVSCYFPEERLLVAGDALNVVNGELVGPREDVTPDLETAWESVGELASLDVRHAFCFHGGYVEQGTDRIRALLPS